MELVRATRSPPVRSPNQKRPFLGLSTERKLIGGGSPYGTLKCVIYGYTREMLAIFLDGCRTSRAIIILSRRLTSVYQPPKDSVDNLDTNTMKFYACLLLPALAGAFSVSRKSTALKMSTAQPPVPQFQPPKPRLAGSDPALASAVVPSFGVMSPLQSTGPANALNTGGSSMEMFIEPIDVMRLEGGQSIRTYKLPPLCERAQMTFRTEGRPLKIKANLWIGPLRSVHEIDINTEDGQLTPYRSTIQFKKDVQPTLRVQTTGSAEFPAYVGVSVPSKERSDEIGQILNKIWTSVKKTHIQGGAIEGGGGAVKIFCIPADVESVSVMFWSRDVGRKSLKVKIEVLQGPNNPKQTMHLQCGGGSQPFHTVIRNPGFGQGWVLRMYNKKFVEDGLFQVAVLPNTPGADSSTPIMPLRSIPPMGG